MKTEYEIQIHLRDILDEMEATDKNTPKYQSLYDMYHILMWVLDGYYPLRKEDQDELE